LIFLIFYHSSGLLLFVFSTLVILGFWFVGFIRALAFPSILIGLLASPLCGAALTFFAAAKKVSKESGLQTASL
jgi:hypothetical protein